MACFRNQYVMYIEYSIECNELHCSITPLDHHQPIKVSPQLLSNTPTNPQLAYSNVLQ